MSNKPRKKKKSSGPKATNSFANMMSQAQLKALKPFIEQQVQMQGFQIQQKVTRLFLEQMAGIQTRIIALEELLLETTNLTQADMATRVTEVEDKGMGYELVEGPAAENDMVRIDYKEKEEGAEYAENWEKLRINALGRKVQDRVQTIEELETALVGMTSGEEKEVYLPPETENVPEGQEAKGAYVLAKMVRVSRKPAPEPVKDEAPNKEESNADDTSSQ